jgi:hypothetical protein
VFHHVGVIDLVHRRHAAAGMALAEIALEQLELLGGRPRAAFGDHEIAVAAQVAALLGRGWNSLATTRTETQARQSRQLGR